MAKKIIIRSNNVRKKFKKNNISLIDDENDSEDCSNKKTNSDQNMIQNPKINKTTLIFGDENKHQIKDVDIVKAKKNIKLTIPWVEKYRPKNINDLTIDDGTLNKIKKIINDKEMPNIIITGVPGIGKTTTILCIAKYLLGKYFGQGVLELNASDDRGIKAVQDSIIYFCKKKLDIESTPERKYAKHKIILLDEADNMTRKAQQLVNTLMEKYHDSTRFAFTCNNSSDIIEAIQSRCIIFRYRRLSYIQVSKRLRFICEKENVQFDESGIEAIVLTAQGDMRQAINNLHITYKGYKIVNAENVYRLCDKPHPMIIENIFLSCYKKDIKGALTSLNYLRDKGYSSSDISISMINTLKTLKIKDIDENTKIKYIRDICETCLIISKGVDTPLQLTGCIAALCS